MKEVLTTQTSNGTNLLKQEIMLQANQRLFDKGMISQEIFEQAKTKIVSPT